MRKSSGTMVMILHDDSRDAAHETRIRIQDDLELAAFAVQLQKIAKLDLVTLEERSQADHANSFALIGRAVFRERKRNRIAAKIQNSFAIRASAGQVERNNIFRPICIGTE